MTETHYRRWPTCTAGPGPRVESHPHRDALSGPWLVVAALVSAVAWVLAIVLLGGPG